ncbi:metallophosphoesterase family protein [Luteimonas sp. Y-2-2-4F]|nr:metallophosphoesterase family protein [Luteimonas sp. Y-2-2-4F]MCD9033948.1 metallophosphoesterase family protein [Luteimonas sp. Y-2-2-4F]
MSLSLATWAQPAAVPPPEPNTLVPAGNARHAASAFPDRIVVSPAQDPARGFGVSWRSAAGAQPPVLEIVEAGDSPDMGTPRRVPARTRALRAENGEALHHQARVDGLQPDTLYAWRVQGAGAWSPWMHTRTLGAADAPLTVLYFGDTQNKNASLTTRVVREALRHAPDATLAVFTGDQVNGRDGDDDNEWGEWFESTAPLTTMLQVAPVAGNHEYTQHEDAAGERMTLGAHWPHAFALPGNGAPGAEPATYWFDAHGARFVVLDGTSALEHGTAQAQARWLEAALRDNPHPWAIALVHQPMYSPRQDRDNALLREHILPVLERERVDLVLQGHDHVYGRRGGEVPQRATPQYIVTVAGAKQYLVPEIVRRQMRPVAEDTQLFQVLRLEPARLRYEARTATGRLYDAFELRRETGEVRLVEIEAGRIPQRDCPRDVTPKGRTDRCWE